MKFKLIVFDLDGTTLKSDLTISDNLKNLLRKLSGEGDIHISVATGRMFAMAKKYIDILLVNSPVISLNGAVIVNNRDGNPLMHWAIDNDVASHIRDILWRYDGSALAISTENVYLSKLTEVALGSIKDWFAEPIVAFPPDDASYLCFFAIGAQNELQNIVDNLKASFSDKVNIDIFPSLRYHPLSYLEIRARDVSKGSGLRFLRKYLGVKKEDVLAIGDWTNDITLFYEAGFTGTLANGAPQLKEIAHIVSPYTNDEDGVVHLLNEIFWGRTEPLCE